MSSSPTSSSSTDAASATYAGMLDVTCRVEVIVGTGSITVRDCLKLQRDSIIRLTQAAGSDLQVHGSGRRRRRPAKSSSTTTRRRCGSPTCCRRQAPRRNDERCACDVRGPSAASSPCLALLGLFVWALRRGSLKLSSLAPKGTIAIETAMSLGERRSIAIVGVEGRRLLIGLTPTTISLPDRSLAEDVVGRVRARSD